MFAIYHQAIVTAQFDELEACARKEDWRDVSFDRDDSYVYVAVRSLAVDTYTYVIRIDLSRYPVDPFWIGFINPSLPRERWASATASDPRFWPWSPMPGLHGSFILVFQGPIRTF